MHRNPSPMQHQFSQVPKAEIPRSAFDRSHGVKTTFDAGLLIPFFVDEALPGDTFTVNATLFGRLATPIFPIMDNAYLDTFFFAVPNRLLWDNWQKFNGEQTNPGDSTSFTIPQVTAAASVANGTLWDYFGLPTNVTPTVPFSVSALPFRAYNLIYNEWFRDENIQNSLTVYTGDASAAESTFTLQRRGKRHDYFTSCLPWPQKGVAVQIPLGTSATVKTSSSQLVSGAQSAMRMRFTGGGAVTSNNTASFTGGNGGFGPTSTGGTATGATYPENLYADLSSATAATINSLRQAFQLQKMLERDARGGTRYTELIRAHFGVTSPDARLQRPEYLGGGTSPINVSPIPQTSSTDATTPQGNLAAMGTVLAKGHGFTTSFTEHCTIIGLCCVRADYTYQQGINRMWSRLTRYDYYWPALAHIGEQAVLSREIFADGTTADDNVFGYQERYAEYRYKPSQITGRFRSTDPASLDAWHLAQEFSTRPTLSSTFIVEDPPIDRVTAVPSQPHVIMDAYIRMRCARPMPVYGVPGLIDHF